MRLASSALLAAALLTPIVQTPTIDVHLIGDSTMADKPTPETNPERGWGQLLPRFFDEHVVVHNHAVNGRSTKSFIAEGKWSAVLSQLKRGDYVFIQFGHNDEKLEDSLRYAAPNTTYRHNLERFVGEARGKGAIPILFTPIVRRKFNDRGELEDTHGAYPGVVREVAKALSVPLIDLGLSTAELVRGAGVERSKTLYVWVAPGSSAMYPTGRQDDTHLSVAGATAVARLAANALRASGIALGKYVRDVPQSSSIPLWNGRAPGALGDSIIDRPSMARFPALPGRSNGTSVVIFPGGGYEHLALEKEGSDVARWLNGLGVSAFVVTYRLAPRYHDPVMLRDAQRAIRVVRANAAAWGLDANRIGAMGFSAGGHMASTAATHFDGGAATDTDRVERVSSRPDFLVLLYPVVTMAESSAHRGSRRNLLGDQPSLERVRAMSNETQVTAASPATFIVATTDDATVPVENSVMFYQALVAAKVPTELHIFETGRHGFGLAPGNPTLSAWLTICESWMRRHSFLG
ncbi:MAG: alpha/beta hydrolase [Gemmatimonadetes bacterium]|nr:alpha/beta hydrolase [Gemmatimonadota bacterium]